MHKYIIMVYEPPMLPNDSGEWCQEGFYSTDDIEEAKETARDIQEVNGRRARVIERVTVYDTGQPTS